MPNIRVNVTKEMAKDIVQLYTEEKVPIIRIAERVGMSVQTIRHTLDVSGIQRNKVKKRTKDYYYSLLDTDSSLRESKALSEKEGINKGYASTIIKDWKALHEKPEPEPRYLMLKDLEDLKSVVRVGDKIRLRSEKWIGRRPVITITGKYPNFAMTDMGAKQWVDIFDAVWCFEENKEVLERCQKLQTA